MIRIPVARKLSTIEERRQGRSCSFGRRDYRRLRSQTRKLSWVRVPVKILELGIIFPMIFNDTYRIVRPMVKLSGNKDLQKM
jgi:hypothetical protein